MKPMIPVVRFSLLALLACLSFCGCATPIATVPATTDWSQTPGLAPNAQCIVSVTAKDKERMSYHGTVESFDSNGVTLSDATLFHTVVTPIPVLGYLPVVGRTFAMEGETAEPIPHVTLKNADILNLTIRDSESTPENPEQQQSSSDNPPR